LARCNASSSRGSESCDPQWRRRGTRRCAPRISYPQRVRDDAAARRDSASTHRPGTDRDLDTVGDSSRDGFAEDYLSALARDGVDPDTARTQLRAGGVGVDTAEQLATRKPGGQETPAARGRENDPIRHRDRAR